MSLAEFIQQNLEAILNDWEAFARTILPATEGVSARKLRDHAREMLVAIATDMQTAQSATEQQTKAEGRRWRATPAVDARHGASGPHFTCRSRAAARAPRAPPV